LVVRIFFPDCLAVDDSVPPQPLLDSPDHRSHMVDAVQPANGGKAIAPVRCIVLNTTHLVALHKDAVE
jgi:hypothetical protein